MRGREFLLRVFDLRVSNRQIASEHKRRQRRFTHENLRNVPVEKFLKARFLVKISKGTFSNEYYFRRSKAHLFDSRSMQGSTDLTHDALEVGQVAQT